MMAQPGIQEQNSPAAVTFVTTEHFVLQTARSAGIAELNGRAGFYLAAVSSGLIALAFIGQLSRLGTGFYVFGLVLLPTLAFVGVTTFERALRNRVEDAWLAGRINRIRQFYFDAAPQVARYLLAPSLDTPAAIAAQAGSSPWWYQFLTIAGALAAVNSVLMGGTAGLAVQAGAGTVAAAASAGVITGGGALLAHFARQRATWRAAARQPVAAPGPAGG